MVFGYTKPTEESRRVPVVLLVGRAQYVCSGQLLLLGKHTQD